MRQSTESQAETAAPAERQPWSPMEVQFLGDLAELVQGGGGKMSTVGDDPGENRKTMGMG
jgi:hypothetical protein